METKDRVKLKSPHGFGLITLAIAILMLAVNVSSSQEPARKALLVIDVQENLLRPTSAIHMDTARIHLFLESVNASVEKFHKLNYPVYYMVNEWSNPIQNLVTGNVCKKGAPGTGLDKRLQLVGNKIYTKSVPNSFSNMQLANQIKCDSVQELYVTGLMAEGCVKGTAKGALKKNLKVTVIKEALGSKNEAQKQKSMDFYNRRGINIITIDEI